MACLTLSVGLLLGDGLEPVSQPAQYDVLGAPADGLVQDRAALVVQQPLPRVRRVDLRDQDDQPMVFDTA
jgi:hypothetical protein